MECYRIEKPWGGNYNYVKIFSSLLQCQEMSFQEYDEYKETKTDLSVIYPRLSVGTQQLSSFSTKSNCNTTLECEYKTVRKIGIQVTEFSFKASVTYFLCFQNYHLDITNK